MIAARSIPIRQKQAAPEHLKAAGTLHWERVTAAYRLDDFELTTLEAACVALDRAAEYRADIEKRGAIVPDRFGILKPNPSADKERNWLDTYRAQNRELGLSMESPESRPPLPRGYK